MTENYRQSAVYDYVTQWKGLILSSNNTSIPVCLYVCVSPRALPQYHTSYFSNTSQSHECIRKYQSPVTVIPVPLPADISTPLAAVVFWIIAPSSRRLSYSSPLAAVICVDHIRPTCLVENWAPRTTPIPAWCRTRPQGLPPYQPSENTKPLGPPATS